LLLLSIPTDASNSEHDFKTRGVQTSNLVCIKSNNSPPIEALLLNARSICNTVKNKNKPLIIHDYIVDKQLDIVAITETWIKPTTPGSTLAAVTPPGYTLDHISRPSGTNGGGVGLIYRNSFKAKKVTMPPFSSFEHMMMTLSVRGKTLAIIVVYRTGPTYTTFLDEFSRLLGLPIQRLP